MKTRLILLAALLALSAFGWLSCKPKPMAPATKTVAIATLMAHPALDTVQQKAREAISKAGYVDGQNVRYILRNASGQVQLAANIADDLASQNPDVIIAITTPMAQAVAKNSRCPVVFAAVTDPVGAGLVKAIDKGEPNITGTCDAWPYGDQLKLIREITPNAKRLGVLFNPGEAASQYGIREIRRLASPLDFEVVEGVVSSTNDVYAVAQNLAGRVDALFLSSDNTVIGGVAAAFKVATEHKLALYVGDSGTVEKGGLATVSVGYAALGTQTGELAVRTLRGERNIPTVVAYGAEIYVNEKSAEAMGVHLPEAVLKRATKVYHEIQP